MPYFKQPITLYRKLERSLITYPDHNFDSDTILHTICKTAVRSPKRAPSQRCSTSPTPKTAVWSPKRAPLLDAPLRFPELDEVVPLLGSL